MYNLTPISLLIFILFVLLTQGVTHAPSTPQFATTPDAFGAIFSPELNINESTAAPGLTNEEIIKRAMQSTLLLRHFSEITVNGQTHHTSNVASAVLIDNKNCIAITNEHVLRHPDPAIITTHHTVTGQTLDQRLAYRIIGKPFAEDDLALIKLSSCAGMPWAHWLHNKQWNYGTKVFTTGHPINQTWTMTLGIISNPYRFSPNSTRSGYPLIQTDAAINPGNSGGGLFLTTGEFIGVNSHILNSDGMSPINNIGFVRSIHAVRHYTEQIVKNNKVIVRAPLQLQSTVQYAPSLFGVQVQQLGDYTPNHTGEIIIAVNGAKFQTEWQFIQLVWSQTEPTITITVIRQNTRMNIPVTFTEKQPQNIQSSG